ncbi:GNAT family N-acetyltransferase [Amycolatopsis sp. 195334CR]|uniref:GNAT family N-acetyltransferase n=1 Tax=Amycolatopsis sp. 195334CR TaxID=2814588 RepID=UPI0027DDA14D|nr:GNAT family N-acetyltransferase [Amycolatopsis sp. 195334CR]
MKVTCLTELTEFEGVCSLFDQVWQPGPGQIPVNPELLRAMSFAGNYVGGAYEDEELIGASVGFFHPPAEAALHSHFTGVTRPGRQVGLALKLHQRAWALDRGADRITWTFDPLVRRNAHFNVNRLGAGVSGYLRDFYGAIEDAVNRGEESDRLHVVWDLHAEPGTPADATAERAAGAVVALSEVDGMPLEGSTDGERLLVGVPESIEELRRADPVAGRAWRQALRTVLGGLLDEGARVTGFDRGGWYVVDRSPTAG